MENCVKMRSNHVNPNGMENRNVDNNVKFQRF